MITRLKKYVIGLTALLASCFVGAGVLQIKNVAPANASGEEISASQLLNTQADMTSDGGLKITSETAYDGAFQGIFTGDTTIKFNFIEPYNEGYYDGNFVFRVADVVDQSKYFDVEYRVLNTWNSDTYGAIGYTGAYVKYGEEIRSAQYSGTAWYNSYQTSGETANFAPAFTTLPTRPQVGILKLGYDANGNFSVSVNKYNADTMKTIAAFDGTDAFDGESTWGLPEMPFENGYTISFSSEFDSDKTTDKATDVCFKSIQNESVTYDLTQTNIQTPSFYSRFLAWNTITIAEHEDFNGYGIGESIVIPAATYTSLSVTQPTAVTDVHIQLPSGGTEQVTVGQSYTIVEAGEHTVVYTVADSIATFSFTVPKHKLYAKDLFNTRTEGAEIAQESGVRISSDVAYSGEIEGVFSGDTTIKFNFPETYEEWYAGNFIFRITDVADESKYFDVEYRVLNTWESKTGGIAGYTGVYVNCGGDIRSARYYGDAWYNDYKTNGETANFAPAFRNFRAQDGILELAYEKGKLTVNVNKNNSTDVRTIAVFDGTSRFKDQISWGLPEMPFENGYKISFSSAFYNESTQDAGTDVCFKQIISDGVTYDLSSEQFMQKNYVFDLEIGNTTQENGNFYIPRGEPLGKAVGKYTVTFGAGAWRFVKNVPLQIQADTATVGAKIFRITDDSFAQEGEAVDKEYTLYVEEPYTVVFDVNGGEAMESIVYSENTVSRLNVQNASKLFWQFDGWYVNGLLWSGNISDLYGRNVTLTAHWKDVESPIIALANGVEQMTVATVGMQTRASIADVKVSDLAQPDSVSVVMQFKDAQGVWTDIAENTLLTLDTVGTYALRYIATDNAGLTAQVERCIQIIQRKSPTLFATGTYQETAVIGETIILADVAANDTDGNALTVVVTIVKDGEIVQAENGDLIPTSDGVYTVTYTAIDEYDLTGIFAYEIVVTKDDVAPTITVDFEDMEVAPATVVSVPTATATDNVTTELVIDVKVTYGTEEIAIQDGAFVAEKIGVYTVVYNTVDQAGNIAEKRVQITVKNPSESVGDNENAARAKVWWIVGGVAIGLVACGGVGIFVYKKIKKNKENGHE